MTSLSFVQSAFYSSTRKNWFDWVVGIINWYLISFYARSFRSIRLFLLDVVQPISLTEAFQLGTKGKNGNLNEVLVITFAHVAVLFKRWVVSHNNRSNLSTDTEVDYVSSRFIQIIVYLVFSTVRQPGFLLGQVFNTLLIFMRYQLSSTFIKPLVFRFEPASINNERLVGRTNDSGKVVKPKINRYCIVIAESSHLINL